VCCIESKLRRNPDSLSYSVYKLSCVPVRSRGSFEPDRIIQYIGRVCNWAGWCERGVPIPFRGSNRNHFRDRRMQVSALGEDSSTKRCHPFDRTMKFSMTSGTKSYKIFFAVVTQLAPKLNMVHLQFARSSTVLAPPIVSFHDLATEPNVVITSEPYSGVFRLSGIHADSFRLLINSSF
jgi:hypothetical protein